MTRLTDDDVKSISDTLDELDAMLREKAGRGLKSIACEAAGIPQNMIDPRVFEIAVVPITSGLGVISRFSESVRDACKWLGFDAYVTEGTDVTGFAEAVDRKASMIFMADDYQYVAYNTAANRQADNSTGTAMGYVACLDASAGGVRGKEVLILGAGRVGSRAARLLRDKGADVVIADIDKPKAEAVAASVPGISVADDIDSAISSHDLILNASPAHVSSYLIRDGAIISSPGVPHTFDEAAYAKATIIHDPLVIGTAAMLMMSASYSQHGIKR